MKNSQGVTWAAFAILAMFYIRGGIKSVFFLLSVKRRGGLAQSKKSLSEKTEVVKKGGGGGLSFSD